LGRKRKSAFSSGTLLRRKNLRINWNEGLIRYDNEKKIGRYKKSRGGELGAICRSRKAKKKGLCRISKKREFGSRPPKIGGISGERCLGGPNQMKN